MKGVTIPSHSTAGYKHANTLSKFNQIPRLAIDNKSVTFLFSVGCIWQFNGCVQQKANLQEPDTICYSTFDECKMIIMGMIPSSMRKSPN